MFGYPASLQYVEREKLDNFLQRVTTQQERMRVAADWEEFIESANTLS